MFQPAIAVPLVFVPGSDRWALISPNAEINFRINPCNQILCLGRARVIKC